MKYYLLAILVALPSITLAQEVYTFNRSIPFLDGISNTANLANALFNIAIVIAAILVVVRLIWAGSRYMTSGLVTSKESAKQDIRDAIIGLLIILGSVTILQTINPQLLNLNALGELDPVQLESPTGVVGGVEGAYAVGDFGIGDSTFTSVVDEFCRNQASRDELCVSRIKISLAEKCREAGGEFKTPEWWEVKSYSCIAAN